MEKKNNNQLMIPMKKRHYFRYIMLSFLAAFFINGIIENIQVNRAVQSFINRGEFVKESVDPATGRTVRYYAVSRETSFENDERVSLTTTEKGTYIGERGDIITTKASPFDEIPVVYQLVSFFFGGHAGVVSATDTYLECVGNQGENNCVRYNPNDWFYIRSSTIGLRLKDADADDYEQIVENVEDKLGLPYNYTFCLNTSNSYYCTDLISTSVMEYDKSLNPNDYLVTTVNDLVASKNTYMFYYHYVDSDNVMHVYYLE